MATAPGMIYTYLVLSGEYAPNSNVMNLQDSVTGNWGFNYDTLNRLIWANASSGPNSNQYGCWGYDSFGNRTHEVFSTTSISSARSSPCRLWVPCGGTR